MGVDRHFEAETERIGRGVLQKLINELKAEREEFYAIGRNIMYKELPVLAADSRDVVELSSELGFIRWEIARRDDIIAFLEERLGGKDGE